MNFSSDEIDLLIYRYLEDSGFQESAFSFAKESNVLKPNINVSQVPKRALRLILQKRNQNDTIDFHNEDSNVENLIDKLTLIETARTDILEIIKKKKESQKTNTMTVCNNTDEDMKDDEDDFDRDEIEMNSGPIEILPSCGRLGKLNNIICAWHPIDNLLAGGSRDGTAGICYVDNVPNLNEIIFDHRLVMPIGQVLDNIEPIDVTCLDWSFDGKYLAVGAFDSYGRVWTTGGRLSCIFGQNSPIFALKWNQEGNYILTGEADGTTTIWNSVVDNYCMQKFDFHSGPVLDVAWKTNTTFASCSADTLIYVCELNKKKALKKFEGHTRDINSIEWDPQGNLLASCSDDKTLKIWSMNREKCVHNFQAHSKTVFAVKWSPTGPGSRNPNRNLILASSSLDATIRLWDVESSLCVRTLTQHKEEIFAIDFSPDGKFLVSGSCDSFVYIWSLDSGEVVHTFKANGGIFDVAWNSRGDQIAVSSFDGYVFILDLRQVRQ